MSHFIKLSLPSLLKSEPRNSMIILEKEVRQLGSKYLVLSLVALGGGAGNNINWTI